MGENSNIEWTDHTFNPWIGCAHVSPGCENCYAENNTYFVNIQRSKGKELWGVNAPRHIASEQMWRKPFAWNAAAAEVDERHRVFCASLADVFEDRPDLRVPRARLLGTIALTPHLDWLLLTKRPEGVMRLVEAVARDLHSDPNRSRTQERRRDDAAYNLADRWVDGKAPANVWIGATGEDCRRVLDRAEALDKIPARVKFMSAEPLLEDIAPALETVLGIEWEEPSEIDEAIAIMEGKDPPFGSWVRRFPSQLDWIIFGGESGVNARPCDIEWIRRGVDVCRGAHATPFVKQLGSKVHSTAVSWPNKLPTKHKKGGDITEFPPDLRIREFPTPRSAA